MTADPIDLVPGLPTPGVPVSKAGFVGYEKERGIVRMNSLAEFRDTDLSLRYVVIFSGRLYVKNTADQTSEDDGAQIIRDLSGVGRWYRVVETFPVNLGIWSDAVTYQEFSGVNYAGSFYISLVADNLNNQPDESPDEWFLAAEAGESFGIDEIGTLAGRDAFDDEEAGFTYFASDTGDLYIKLSGASGDWSDPIDFQGPQGDPAVVVCTSTTNITIGLGAHAMTVSPGDFQTALGQRLRFASDDGTKIIEGEVTTLAMPVVTITADYIEGSGAHGDWNGSIAGARGRAATVAVGSTTTGAPGTSASVNNTGTTEDAVFAFTIPRGDAYEFDEVVDTFADKAAFDAEPKGFGVLVIADENEDGATYAYWKLSNTNGDWSQPAAFSGGGGGSANYDDVDVLTVASML